MGDDDVRGMVVRPATSLADFLFARRLRNEVRLGMTGNTAAIGIRQQLLFWLRRPPAIEIYMAVVGGKRAGYLLLRTADGTCYITEAVDDAFRRQGVAAALVRFAQRQRAELTADIRADNAASIALHEGAGFTRVGSGNGILRYRYCRGA